MSDDNFDIVSDGCTGCRADSLRQPCLRALASPLFKSCRHLLQSAGSERLVNRLVKVLQAK